jgi:hypothetical protein
MKAIRILCVTLLVAIGCSSKENPGGPTPTTPVAGIRLSNLEASPLGLKRTLCFPGPHYVSVDELAFDVDVTGGDILGAKLVNRSDTGVTTTLGDSIAQCSLGEGPCQDFGHSCLVSGSGSHGRVRAYVGADWQPVMNWRISVVSDVARSNELTARIDRTDDLPYGDRSGIVELRIEKCVRTLPIPPTATCYVAADAFTGDVYNVNMSVYNPRQPGRIIRTRIDVSNPQTRLTISNEYTFTETDGSSMTVGLGAQIVTSVNTHPSPPFSITGSVREFQGTSTIVETTKQISYP